MIELDLLRFIISSKSLAVLGSISEFLLVTPYQHVRNIGSYIIVSLIYMVFEFPHYVFQLITREIVNIWSSIFINVSLRKLNLLLTLQIYFTNFC